MFFHMFCVHVCICEVQVAEIADGRRSPMGKFDVIIAVVDGVSSECTPRTVPSIGFLTSVGFLDMIVAIVFRISSIVAKFASETLNGLVYF